AVLRGRGDPHDRVLRRVVIRERAALHAAPECLDDRTAARDHEGRVVPVRVRLIRPAEAKLLPEPNELAEEFGPMREDEVAWFGIDHPLTGTVMLHRACMVLSGSAGHCARRTARCSPPSVSASA